MAKKYSCDVCEKTFEESEVKYTSLIKNFHLIGTQILVHNTESNTNYFTSTNMKLPGDCTLSCPHCDATHLFGFNAAKE